MADEKKDKVGIVDTEEHENVVARKPDTLPTKEQMEDIIKYKTVSHSTEKKLTNVFYGLHTYGMEEVAPLNREDYGYTFFTRPQLNLTKTNIVNDRILYALSNPNRNSVQRYIRMMLDPRLGTESGGGYSSDLVDNKLAFIPVLTNRLITISGFQDLVLPTYTSPPGLKKIQQSYPNGNIDIYDSYDLEATFANMAEEPFTMLFYTWMRYMSQVHEGIINPYIDMIIARVFDFNTRIYRIVLDEQKKYVKKVAMTGACLPTSVPMGKFFDMSKNVPLHSQNKEVNIRFKCDGMYYNDAIIIDDFNRVVKAFNPAMKEMDRGVNNDYILVPRELEPKIAYRAYPRIDPLTYEFQWWVPKSVLKLKDPK